MVLGGGTGGALPTAKPFQRRTSKRDGATYVASSVAADPPDAGMTQMAEPASDRGVAVAARETSELSQV
eukprot:1447737-Prymnesium_polylepis.1